MNNQTRIPVSTMTIQKHTNVEHDEVDTDEELYYFDPLDNDQATIAIVYTEQSTHIHSASLKMKIRTTTMYNHIASCRAFRITV